MRRELRYRASLPAPRPSTSRSSPPTVSNSGVSPFACASRPSARCGTRRQPAAPTAAPTSDDAQAPSKGQDTSAARLQPLTTSGTKFATTRAKNNDTTTRSVTSSRAGASEKSMVTDGVGAIWHLCLNQVVRLSEQLLQSGDLTLADLDEARRVRSAGDEWLGSGLLAYMLLTAVRRSADGPGIRLAFAADQPPIELHTCPSEHVDFFRSLMALKGTVAGAGSITEGSIWQALLSRALYGPSGDDDWHQSLADDPTLDAPARTRWQLAQRSAQTLAKHLSDHDLWRARWPPTLALIRSTFGTSTSKDPSSPAGDVIWASVLNRCFAIGEQAIADRLVPIEDVRAEEPYLYLGLVGATILDALRRSLALKSADGIELAIGRTITLATCPSELEPLMKALVAVKQGLIAAAFSDVEWQALRRTILWAQAEGKPDPLHGIESGKAVAINRCAAGLQSVATSVTQMPTFKNNFSCVLRLLSDS